MTEDDRIQFLESNLARQLQWIAHAESKSSVVLAIDTAMVGVLAAISPEVVSEWTWASAIFTAATTLLTTTSLIYLLRAGFPQTDGPKGSLIFFGGIVAMGGEQYWRAVAELSPEPYAKDLASQCHRNAEIAQKKFLLVRKALGCLYLAVPPWIAAIYLLRVEI